MGFKTLRRAVSLLCALLAAACSSIPSQDGRLVDPTVEPKSSPSTAASEAPPQGTGPVDVYLIPLDDFPEAALPRFAKRLARETELHVRIASSADISGLRPYQSSQYATDELLRHLMPKAAALPDSHSKTIYIAYTKRDINDPNGKANFLFAQSKADLRISVISAFRMSGSTRWEIPPVFLADRIHKMSKRAVGDLYFRYPRTSEVKDLMYSPILSTEDIDRIGNDFMKPRQKSEAL